ncbi:SprB repeat-containing protein [Tunicatimonas pelagia]|uniref:SprB repeat-containing protein n=1 Tax=Tunicatimonas pelagia TaxID=931531 RepID=UPI002665B11F|nr:hypothetical protein [Tunicatimonas pelagia]WKN43847.1 hypothetical protein P0M28_02535 [Tunicatimonas pelagia]
MRNLFHTLVLTSFILALLYSCTYEVVPEPQNCDNAPALQLLTVTDADCGLASGAVQVEASGGEAPYLFRINDGSEQSDGLFSGLSAGSHIITVEDANGCEGTLEVQVANRDGVNTTVAKVDASCGSTDGQINVSAEGGAAPYQFRINDQPFQSNRIFSGLAPGEYEVITQDANGCESVQTVLLSSGVAFEAVETIVKNNCALSNCHDGTISPDFRTAATIQNRAARIQARTASKSMPPASSGRELTDQQIQDIACWVGDGASTE